MKVKAAVVGVGHIGREHARIYSTLEDVEFVGVYDINHSVAQRVAHHCQTRAFSHLEELFDVVDCVSIATPTSTHYEVALPFLQRGRSVLIEKPITNSLETAQALVGAARRSGAILQVGHIERFNPVLRSLQNLLTHPRFIEAHRLSPYPGRSTDIGVVLDLMIHDLDVILCLVQSPVVSIDAVGVPVLSQSEDIANARLRFANGCIANVTTSRISTDKLRKIRIFQQDAYISLDYQNQTGEIYRKVGYSITREKVPVIKEEPLRLEIQSFVQCVKNKAHPVVSGEQGSAALEVAMRITDLIMNGLKENTAQFSR